MKFRRENRFFQVKCYLEKSIFLTKSKKVLFWKIFFRSEKCFFWMGFFLSSFPIQGEQFWSGFRTIPAVQNTENCILEEKNCIKCSLRTLWAHTFVDPLYMNGSAKLRSRILYNLRFLTQKLKLFRIIVNATPLTPGHIVNRLKNGCPWSGDDF